MQSSTLSMASLYHDVQDTVLHSQRAIFWTSPPSLLHISAISLSIDRIFGTSAVAELL